MTGDGRFEVGSYTRTILGVRFWGVCAVSDVGGWVLPMSGNFAMPWIKVATNKALEIDCATSTIEGIITYGIVSV